MRHRRSGAQGLRELGDGAGLASIAARNHCARQAIPRGRKGQEPLPADGVAAALAAAVAPDLEALDGLFRLGEIALDGLAVPALDGLFERGAVLFQPPPRVDLDR